MPMITALQSKLMAQILAHARFSGWEAGHHLTEDSLNTLLGTSRTPIRSALAQLEAQGVLEKRPNKGYFLLALPTQEAMHEDIETLYAAIAMARVQNTLPDSLSENELMRRFPVSRAQLKLTLARIASEGWIERKPGRGWAFAPLIDSLEAYKENYRFRIMIEPSMLLSASFLLDQTKIEQLIAQQMHVKEKGYLSHSQIELYEINARFHEGLAMMAHNRFVLQTLQRLNQLRRLIEYSHPLDRERARRVSDEHLAILYALKNNDAQEAARLLSLHLEKANQEKAENYGQK